jgi:hypothetical protein
MSLFLSDDDLEVLTRRERAGAQCRALTAMGIPFVTGPEGHPRVLRSVVESMMGAAPGRAMLPTREPQLRP